ncbi:MAG: LPS export ABC transporter permease LptF [Pseudomonadota bacterium]
MIIERYIIKEVLQTLLAVTGVLFLIYVSNRFVRFLAEADSGVLPAGMVVELLALKSLNAAVLLLPLALYLSIMLAFGRLYKDSEMTALAACGVGPGRLLKNMLGMGLAAAVVVAGVSLYAGPWAEERSYQLLDRAKARSDISAIAPGNFRESSSGDLIVYVERQGEDRQSMNNVFIQSEKKGRQNIIAAPSAFQRIDPSTGDRFVVLQNGFRYEGMPGDADFKIIEYKEHAVRVEEKAIEPASRKLAAIPTAALLASDEPGARAEFQWRIAMPVSVVLLALLAVPLSRSNPRQGRYAKLFAAILIYVIYNNLLGVGRAWLEKGTVPPEAGLWWVHGVLLIGIAVLMVRQTGVRWVLSRVA